MSGLKKAMELKTFGAKIRMETLEVNEGGYTRKVQIYFENEAAKSKCAIQLDDKEFLNLKLLLGAL
jgi:hypothetical protein